MTMTTMCNTLVSKVTRRRAFVVSIGLMLPALSVLWRLDGSNSRYLQIATTNLRATIGSVTTTVPGWDADKNLSNATGSSNNESSVVPSSHLFRRDDADQTTWQEPTQETVAGAIEFVMNRRLAYHQHKGESFSVANQWKLRGHGYLYKYQNIVLAAEGPQQQQQQQQQEGQSSPSLMGRNVVKIWNVHPQKTAHNLTNCDLLTLWVRVYGPEIFAGRPRVVMDGPLASSSSSGAAAACHWEFEFDIQKAGVYEVDVKMLLWNGKAPVKQVGNGEKRPNGRFEAISQCPDTIILDQNASMSVVENSHHNGFLGFKFYSPVSSCCEVCRRVEGCIHWSTPPTNFDANNVRNGCELYYNQTLVDLDDIPKSHYLAEAGVSQEQRRRRLDGVVRASGSPASNNSQVAQFLGCGWSFHHTLDFPCLDGNLDDHVFMVNRTFVVDNDPVAEASSLSVPSSKRSQSDLPLCQVKDEAFRTDNKRPGRWVREDLSNNKTCPFPRVIDKNVTTMFAVTAFNGDYPHCWHRDDLSVPRKHCGEMNCRLIPKSSKWESSPLHQETDWMGTWRNYDCDYMEFTNNQLQQCITQRKIQSISTSGVSISAMMDQYLKVRMKDIELYTPDAKDEHGGEPLSVVIDSLKWPHLLWREDEDEWVEQLTGLPDVNATKKEHYWVSSFFASSEREPYVHVGRAEQLAQHAERILTPKGYKMIDAFELSAAFTYDTAGQGDGLHIIGPPMKAIWTKVLHHMCSEFVEGTVYDLSDQPTES